MSGGASPHSHRLPAAIPARVSPVSRLVPAAQPHHLGPHQVPPIICPPQQGEPVSPWTPVGCLLSRLIPTRMFPL